MFASLEFQETKTMPDTFCPAIARDEKADLMGWCPTPKPYWGKKPLSGLLDEIWEWPSQVVDAVPATFEAEKTLEQKFYKEAEKWERETGHLSSTAKRVLHSSYQAIMAMGPPVVPLLLRDLQRNRRDWLWALYHLTQANPINPSDAGKMDRMITAWVNWGKANGKI